MRPHMVIGASGMVGQHLLREVQASGNESVGTYCAHESQPGLIRLDIVDQASVGTAIRQYRPAVIYLAAACTNVDYCEEHPDESYHVNVCGVRNVVEAANSVRSRLVFFSSDYVFDGRSGPYSELDPVRPVCEYGRQKVYGEDYVALNALDFIIIRTTVVFGPEQQGKNFVCRLARELGHGKSMRVPNDQWGSPTYAPDLAHAAVRLAAKPVRGVLHVAGPEVVSRTTFARDAARVFGFDEKLIEGVSTDVLQQKARRPLRAGMRTDLLRDRLGKHLRSYQQGLVAMRQWEEA